MLKCFIVSPWTKGGNFTAATYTATLFLRRNALLYVRSNELRIYASTGYEFQIQEINVPLPRSYITAQLFSGHSTERRSLSLGNVPKIYNVNYRNLFKLLFRVFIINTIYTGLIVYYGCGDSSKNTAAPICRLSLSQSFLRKGKW